MRSHLLFGAPVLGLRLDPLLSARTPPSIARMCTIYRTLQRTILGISSTVRSEILAAVSTRPPLDILIRKLVWRYYHHVTTATPSPAWSPPSAPGLPPWMMNATVLHMASPKDTSTWNTTAALQQYTGSTVRRQPRALPNPDVSAPLP